MKRLTILTLAILSMLTACTLPSGISEEESSEISEVSEVSEISEPIVVSYEEYVPPIIVSATKGNAAISGEGSIWELTIDTGEIIFGREKSGRHDGAHVLRFFPFQTTTTEFDLSSDTGDFVEMVIDLDENIIRQFEKRSYGFYDINSKEYTEVEFFDKTIQKYGLLDSQTLEVVLEPQYDDIVILMETMEIGILQEGKMMYGLADFEGNIIIPVEYEYISHFWKDDTLIAKKDGKFGHINIQNEVVTPFEYELVSRYYLGIAAVYPIYRFIYEEYPSEGSKTIGYLYNFQYINHDGEVLYESPLFYEPLEESFGTADSFYYAHDMTRAVMAGESGPVIWGSHIYVPLGEPVRETMDFSNMYYETYGDIHQFPEGAVYDVVIPDHQNSERVFLELEDEDEPSEVFPWVKIILFLVIRRIIGGII